MKRKTSQETCLSCQTDLVVRFSHRGETITPSLSLCFLGRFSSIACACSLIVLCLLLSPCFSVIFRYFSYLDKLLGTLTRVVKVDHTTLGLLETAIRQRVVPQSYCPAYSY